MGLARCAIKLIAETVRNSHLKGRVLVIGKQDVWGSEEQVLRWLRESGVEPSACETRLSLKREFSERLFIQDTSLFKLMGFHEVVTLDNSDFEGAEIIYDLNKPISEQMLAQTGRFDLIIDSGCSEHIFNLPQVLRNYQTLAAEQGVVIHILPSSNHVDHGFYMFSPTLFQDYYSANQWSILQHYFIRYFQDHDTRKWKVYKYRPTALDRVSFGGLPGGLFAVFIAVQKQSGSTSDADVQQGMYVAAWRQSPPRSDSNIFKKMLNEFVARYVPKVLLPTVMLWYLRIVRIGGLGRYLEHYKDL